MLRNPYDITLRTQMLRECYDESQKRFSIYYSDDPAILDSWFKDTEVEEYITYRNFERNNLFEGL